jgi:hypothetical protein
MAVLGLLELLVRAELDLYRCDERLGWTFSPGASGLKLNRYGEFLERVRLNSSGFHDGEHALAKPEGTYRIVVLGDSVAASLQVPRERGFLALLEAELSARARAGRTIELINAGIDGFGTAQELLLLREEGLGYDPNLVLLEMFIANDLTDNSIEAGNGNHYLALRCGRPYFVLEDGEPELVGLVRTPQGGGSLERILRRSHLYATLVPPEGDGARVAFGDHDVARFGESPAVTASWELTRGLVRALAEEAGHRGVPLVVVAVPDKIAVGQLSELQRESGFDTHPHQAVHQALDGFLEAEGIAHVDLHPALAAYVRERGPAYFEVDSHWNEVGHAVAAQALSGWLAANCERLGLPLAGCGAPGGG